MFAREWLPPVVAGFITVLVGFTSSAAIVFQAAQAAGANTEQIGSWMLALGIGMGLTCIGLSLTYRVPVVTAWSTPGAALLVTGLSGVPMDQAIGAFVFCAALIVIAGATGWFERIIDRIPQSLAAALLAGVLVRFGIDAFVALKTQFWIVMAMCVAYLIGKRCWPRYAVVGVLAIGIAIAAALGAIDASKVRLEFATPVFTMPAFSPAVLLGVGLPLFIVTMASQNVPGIAVLRGSGYGTTPISPLITWTGVASLVLAPFGGYALNLAAITAALCMGPQAHEDPARRWRASVAAGVFYLIVAAFGASVALLFAALPHELIVAVAGLALIPTIANGLAAATADARWREPALVAFLVTASGVTLASVGSAFWGLVAGVLSAGASGAWRKPAA
jgi:benzoate membrane transport protein